MNGDCDNEQKDTKTIRQEEAFDQSQIDGVQGKELTSFHPSLTVSDTKSPTGSDNCLGVKVVRYSAMLINLKLGF